MNTMKDLPDRCRHCGSTDIRYVLTSGPIDYVLCGTCRLTLDQITYEVK